SRRGFSPKSVSGISRPLHFEGVEFSYGYPPKDEDTIVVSEAVCSKFIRLACEKYLQRHPGTIKGTVLFSLL
ncbi:ribonuclease toxin immunity protein CdiI, partial [Pseudomonas aeruginosa]